MHRWTTESQNRKLSKITDLKTPPHLSILLKASSTRPSPNRLPALHPSRHSSQPQRPRHSSSLSYHHPTLRPRLLLSLALRSGFPAHPSSAPKTLRPRRHICTSVECPCRTCRTRMGMGRKLERGMQGL